jgi:hypothetical protein
MVASIHFTSTAEKVDFSLLPKKDTRYQYEVPTTKGYAASSGPYIMIIDQY